MVTIDAMRDSDWPEVRAIYGAGLGTGIACFMKDPPDWKVWNESHLTVGRLVVRDGDGCTVGWAALTPAPDTCGTAGVAEVSVYVSENAQRSAAGTALLEGLIAASEAEGYWTLQAMIMAANLPSAALHRKCGFREVGCRERYGHLDGVWHDVLLFERRSALTGGPGLPTRGCCDGAG